MGGEIQYDPNKKEDQCIFIKRSEASKVLAVGHLDYVESAYTDPMISVDGTKIQCGQLDDRLGVWTITKLLPDYIPADMPYDILLTDQEECGKSTARLFLPENNYQYNWIFEFDRKSTEVVMYDYRTAELDKLLEEVGFKVGTGSWTDIRELARLNCAAFNIGTAYYGEHKKECYANLPELISQVTKFIKFYKAHYNTHLLGDQKKALEGMQSKYTTTKYLTAAENPNNNEGDDPSREDTRPFPTTIENGSTYLDWEAYEEKNGDLDELYLSEYGFFWDGSGYVYFPERNMHATFEDIQKDMIEEANLRSQYLGENDPFHVQDHFPGGRKNRELLA